MKVKLLSAAAMGLVLLGSDPLFASPAKQGCTEAQISVLLDVQDSYNEDRPITSGSLGYYLLDWKSNHLGNAVEAYHRDHLGKAMQDNLYRLQYLLYTVALDRFLSLRVPGYRYHTHFGGAIYVFLRGVSSELGEEYGFYRDLPQEALIRELQELLIETETGEDDT